MNISQKNALSALVFLFVTNIIFAYVFFRLFVLKKAPESFAGRFLPLAILILISGTLLVWTLKRQSPKEVKADERDKLIDHRAATAFLASSLIVIPAVSVIPRLVLGDNGCIPAWSLPLINYGAIVILAMIYFAAVLVQYGRGGKDDEK